MRILRNGRIKVERIDREEAAVTKRDRRESQIEGDYERGESC